MLNASQKAAIYLNNAAVDLLVRSCFPEAVDICKNALQIMKNEAEYKETENVGLLLQRACKQSAMSADIKYPSTVMCVISSEATPSAVSSIAASLGSQQFPIKIDLVDHQDFDVDYYSAVVLYNYGIAVSNCKISETPYQIFALTQTLLVTNCHQSDCKCLLLRGLVAYCMSAVALQLKLHYDYQKHLETMNVIIRQIMECYKLWTDICNVNVAPAA